jgi:hypothetical protein
MVGINEELKATEAARADWLEGQFDRLPAVMADLVRRRVAVIATPAGNFAAQAATG